jgi:antitoxin MazE
MYTHSINTGENVKAKIQKWGNSLGVRIPSSVARELRLSENSQVELRAEDGKLVLEPSLSREEMIDQISEQNRHSLADWGNPRGREIW